MSFLVELRRVMGFFWFNALVRLVRVQVSDGIVSKVAGDEVEKDHGLVETVRGHGAS